MPRFGGKGSIGYKVKAWHEGILDVMGWFSLSLSHTHPTTPLSLTNCHQIDGHVVSVNIWSGVLIITLPQNLYYQLGSIYSTVSLKKINDDLLTNMSYKKS